MKKISAFVITKDEEDKLKDCLKSLDFVDEIILVDSGSSDQTVKIAKEYGCKTYFNPWPGYGKQKNFALKKTQNDWVFSVDADERVSQELKEEILNLPEKPDFNGFLIPRRNYFLGKLIKHGGPWWYPDHILRLFRKSQGQFSASLVHEKVDLKGEIGYLKNPLIHYSYDSCQDYFRKMNYQTSLQASQKGVRGSLFWLFLKPVYRFLQMYFRYLGLSDGLHGLILAIFSGIYEFSVQVKIWEKKNADRN